MTGIGKSIKINGIIVARETVGQGCQWVQVSLGVMTFFLEIMTFFLEINSDGGYKTLVNAEELYKLYTLKVWALQYVNYFFPPKNGLTHISEDVRNQKSGWKKIYICMYVCPPPGEFPDPGIEPASLTFPSLTGGSLPLAPPGKLYIYIYTHTHTHIWLNAR